MKVTKTLSIVVMILAMAYYAVWSPISPFEQELHTIQLFLPLLPALQRALVLSLGRGSYAPRSFRVSADCTSGLCTCHGQQAGELRWLIGPGSMRGFDVFIMVAPNLLVSCLIYVWGRVNFG